MGPPAAEHGACIPRGPDVDVVICVLEAARIARPSRGRILRDGLEHADPLVRWTAVRLIGHEGDAMAAALPAQDPSPLVQARLDHIRGQ